MVESASDDDVVITDKRVEEELQTNPLAYDKQGDMHYDIISAFIKSIQGSDPDATALLDGKDDRRRRRPAVHCPPCRYLCCRRHWSGQSQCGVCFLPMLRSMQ